jgi:hypothetical protein
MIILIFIVYTIVFEFRARIVRTVNDMDTALILIDKFIKYIKIILGRAT